MDHPSPWSHNNNNNNNNNRPRGGSFGNDISFGSDVDETPLENETFDNADDIFGFGNHNAHVDIGGATAPPEQLQYDQSTLVSHGNTTTVVTNESTNSSYNDNDLDAFLANFESQQQQPIQPQQQIQHQQPQPQSRTAYEHSALSIATAPPPHLQQHQQQHHNTMKMNPNNNDYHWQQRQQQQQPYGQQSLHLFPPPPTSATHQQQQQQIYSNSNGSNNHHQYYYKPSSNHHQLQQQLQHQHQQQALHQNDYQQQQQEHPQQNTGMSSFSATAVFNNQSASAGVKVKSQSPPIFSNSPPPTKPPPSLLFNNNHHHTNTLPPPPSPSLPTTTNNIPPSSTSSPPFGWRPPSRPSTSSPPFFIPPPHNNNQASHPLSPAPINRPSSSTSTKTETDQQQLLSIPLSHWIHSESLAGKLSQEQSRTSTLRKTTVAYGLAELLHYVQRDYTGGDITIGSSGDNMLLTNSDNGLLSTIQISNFVIRLANTPDATIEGIAMLSPPITLRIISPFFLSDDFLFDNDGNDITEEDLYNCYDDDDDDIMDDLLSKIARGEDISGSSGGNGGKKKKKKSGAKKRASDAGDDYGGGVSKKQQKSKLRKEEVGQFLEVEIVDATSSSSLSSSLSRRKIRADQPPSPMSGGGSGGSSSTEENLMCHLFGVLLYELYSEIKPFADSSNTTTTTTTTTTDPTITTTTTAATASRGDIGSSDHSFLNSIDDIVEPITKKKSFHETATKKNTTTSGNHNKMSSSSRTKTFSDVAYARAMQVSSTNKSSNSKSSNSDSNNNTSNYAPLKDLGLPSSISLLVRNLLECGWDEYRPDDAVPSLKVASDDLHLLLQDPGRFLFDRIGSVGLLAAAVTGTGGGDGGGGTNNGQKRQGQGIVSLDIKQNKLYGRDAERSAITDVFCRVSFTGESEALFIEGFSGSGKSKLVQSVMAYVDVAGAYIVRKKFDKISQERPMSVVMAAFDDLCPLIAAKLPPIELNQIVVDLMAVFGSHLSTLARVLPNVALLSPELTSLASSTSLEQQQGGKGINREINYDRVYFILQLFMRVVSSKPHPVILFLDDLHWADNASLDILKSILSDIKGASCVYFVGSYRTNEVPPDHAIFRFMDALESCNVKLGKVPLDGLELEDINHIISDALGIFPRICKPLSSLVLRKTEGNPLFVLECLRSLVDRNLLQYSFRERRWVWDMDKIAAEDLADNVCELLKTKMIGLSENTQQALKIASCFGNTIHMAIVDIIISASPNFAFQSELDKAAEDGFMNKNSDGSGYKFRHDKVREAAYDLIEEEEREQFHHNIGMLLYYSTQGQNTDKLIFLIVDQINHGTIKDPQLQIKIAELNYKAASKALNNSNFAAAYFYSTAAIKLLPPDHWECHYDLSRDVFSVQGNAAYTDGREEDATRALDMILLHGKSLKDKLDAYDLKISLLHRGQQGQEAYDLGLEVLKQLGEKIPKSVDPESFKTTVANIQSKLGRMMESDLLNMKLMKDPILYSLMQFYNQVCHISYFVNPPMLKWYAAKLLELTLEHGVCKYSALGIMRYSMILGGKLIQDVEGGYRLGKVSLKLLERFDRAQDLIPGMYLCYYGYIAVHIEPFQSCADMLKRGMEIGLSTGDIQTALQNGLHYVQKSLITGMNLLDLKKECDYQMRLIDANSQPLSKMYMSRLHQSIVRVMLIVQRDSTADPNMPDEDDASVTEFTESQTFHNVWQSFWLGHYDRCLYNAEKSSALNDIGQLKSIMIIFYGGLSCFHLGRQFRSSKKLNKMVKNAIEVMREKGEKSSWNYQNKIHLLEAEMLSATDNKAKAKISYNAAIAAARSSKFINEQGLACEFAALHCLKHNEINEAGNLLRQALECYAKWGSQVKIDQIKKQLERVGPSPSGANSSYHATDIFSGTVR